MIEKRADVMSRGASYGEDEIVCPWCGLEETDSWEWSPTPNHGPEGSGSATCSECGKDFECARDVQYSYRTSRP